MRTLPYLLLLTLLVTGCLEDKCEDIVTYQVYEPVTVSAGDWRASTFAVTEPSGEVCDPSGFYVYGDYLFVLDRGAGLHVIENSDNDNPNPVAFVAVPGGEGIAVRNDVLYINQYVDLLAFDLREPAAPKLLSRTEDVFEPGLVFAYGILAEDTYIVDYVATDERYEVDCNSPQFQLRNDAFMLEDMSRLQVTSGAFNSAGTPLRGQPDQVGQGGSLARFTITQGNLYVVEDNSLKTFSLADPSAPEYVTTNYLDWGIETIFSYGELLFIGSQTGMHIFSARDPLAPEFLSTFEHVRHCDPVVVQNDLAYVTMWGGSECGNQGDRLMVIDVSDPASPELLQETPMSNSHGLGIDGDRLFLCSGPEGLGVYTLTGAGLLGERLHDYSGIEAKDVIVRADRHELVVFGWNQAGIRQLDYTNDGALSVVSEINICD